MALSNAIKVGGSLAGLSLFVVGLHYAPTLFETTGAAITTVVKQSGEYKAPTSYLSADAKLRFGDKDYLVTGSDTCPGSSDHPFSDCIRLVPGENKVLYLRQAGSPDLKKGIATITGTMERPGISLKRILSADGLEQTLSPPLAGAYIVNPD